MVVLISIEGLGDDSSYPNSFCRKLYQLWRDSQKHYVATHMQSIKDKAKEGLDKALAWTGMPDYKGIILCGYSQGGAAAIHLAGLLGEAGIQVDMLVLIDAVGWDTYGEGPFYPIPDSVRMTRHAHRTWSSGSRPLWWNCGMKGANNFRKEGFFVTHGSAAGVDLEYHHKPAGPDNDIVVEADFFRGGVRETNVTYLEDYQAQDKIKSWLFHQIWGKQYQLESAQTPGSGGGPGAEKFHVVAPGESLSIIAGKYWGDVLLWPAIKDVPRNKSQIGNNPNLISVGLKLLIPDISGLTPQQREVLRFRGRTEC